MSRGTGRGQAPRCALLAPASPANGKKLKLYEETGQEKSGECSRLKLYQIKLNTVPKERQAGVQNIGRSYTSSCTS